MKIIKVNNLFNNTGLADYKGLDLEKIVAGTQLYPYNDNFCALYYMGELPEHSDLEELSQEDYELIKENIKKETPLSDAERLKMQEQAIAELTMIVAMGQI